MTADDLTELLKLRPLKPLPLHLADGCVREILQSKMSRVAAETIVIGAP